MLTVLTVKDYSNKKRGLDWFKRDNTQLEVIKYNKIQIKTKTSGIHLGTGGLLFAA